jgi:hypothetical protein
MAIRRNAMTYGKDIRYEVCTDNVYGSDVLQFDTLKEAKKAAKKWAKEIASDDKRHYTREVIVTKVVTQIAFKVDVEDHTKVVE